MTETAGELRRRIKSLRDKKIAGSAARRVVVGGDFAFIRDSSALVFVSELHGRFRVERERVWKPGEKPLRPSIVFREAMREIEDMRAESLCCDTHYLATVYEITEDTDVEVVPFASSQDGIAHAHVRVRVLLGSGLVDLSRASQQLIDELKEVTGKPTSTGSIQIAHKRTAGSHGDLARSFVSGMYALELASNKAFTDGRAMSGGARRMQRKDRHPDTTDPGYLTDLPRDNGRG